MSFSSVAPPATAYQVTGRTLVIGTITLAAAITVASCGGGASSGHAAVKVCGQVVQPAGGGVEISPTWVGVGNDRTYGSPTALVSVIPEGPRGGTPTIVIISSGCSHGASYTISPAGIVSATVAATAEDRSAVALQLHGVRPGQAKLTVHSGGKNSATDLNYG